MPPKGYKKDNLKKLIHFRADCETESHLEYVSQQTGKSKSEIIRNGIEIQYEEIKKKG